MDRRVFLGTLTGGLLAAPLVAEAQQPSKGMRRVGWLSPASATGGLPNLEALRAGLRELGYVEGQNIAIEARWADGRSEKARINAIARTGIPEINAMTEGFLERE